MSYIQERYGISEDQESQMVKDGLLDWSVNYHWQIYKDYCKVLQSMQNMPSPKMSAVVFITEKYNIGKTSLYNLINYFRQRQ